MWIGSRPCSRPGSPNIRSFVRSFGTRLDYCVGHVARSPVHLAELRRSGGLRFVALLPEHPAYHEQQGDSAGALSLTRHLVTVSPDGSRMPGVGAIQGSVVPTSKSPHR